MINEELEVWDEELPPDDYLGVDDPLDLVRAFIDCTLAKSFFCDSQQEPAAPAKVAKPLTNGRLCFVITKNKSSSWAEDLSDFTSLAELNRVYN